MYNKRALFLHIFSALPLEGVGSSRWFGWAGAPGSLAAPPLRWDPFEQA
jgi:hypothetical protein